MQQPLSSAPGGSAAPSGGGREAAFAMAPRTFTGFLVAVAAVIIIAVLSYDSLSHTTAASQELRRAVEALAQLQGIPSTLKDAETGQRGYLLTGRDPYMEPFESAKKTLPLELASGRSLLADDT